MKRILIVEDEPEIRQLLASYLINEGYSVSETEDGVTAIELFSKEKFDLLILDIMIPKIDGYGVCEFVKKKSDVPVIFLSALDDERSMVKGYDSLADDYVTKPFSMPVFLRKVKAVLRRDRPLCLAVRCLQYDALFSRRLCGLDSRLRSGGRDFR